MNIDPNTVILADYISKVPAGTKLSDWMEMLIVGLESALTREPGNKKIEMRVHLFKKYHQRLKDDGN
jgi:hypothetical protein